MKASLISSYYPLVLWVFLISQVFEGALKFALGNSSLTYLMYAPKLAIIAVIVHVSAEALRSNRVSSANFQLALLLSVSIILGIVSIGSVSQVFFGLYILTPMIFGMAMGRSIRIGDQNLNLVRMLFYAALVGLVIDYFYDVPWQGFSYESFGRENEGSRSWYYLEASRPAGFSSISWNAASHIAIFGIILFIKEKNLFFRALVIPAMFVGVLISTTKGALLAVIAAILFSIAPKFAQKIVLWLLIIISIILPASSILYGYELSEPDTLLGAFTYSFTVRLTEQWPGIFGILGDWNNYILGKGLGITGGASFRTLTDMSNAPDSFFLFMLLSFGIVGVLFFYLLIIKAGLEFIKSGDKVNSALMIAFMTYGLVVSGVEFGVWGMVLGMLIGNIRKSRMKKKLTENYEISQPRHHETYA